MPWNGAGTYSPPAASFPAVAGTLIQATKFNDVINDMSTGISTCLTKDGQVVATANQPMGGFRHTNVGNAANRNEYAAVGQVQDSSFNWCGTAGGTANDITLTASPAITAYAAGQAFVYKSGAAANTGAMTVAVNGLATKAIQRNGVAVIAADHAANSWFRITYDGAAFQLEPLAPADNNIVMPVCGRITLTTAVPVTTSDVTGATTVYFTPYQGNRIQLYDGTRWNLYTYTEMSQTTADNTKSPAAVANNSNYDIFVWDDAGTLRATRGPAWTSDTARGTGAGTTELELVQGRYVNKIAITNGPTAQKGLYVGTIRSDGSAQINDSLAKRHVWNNFNRRVRPMRVLESADSWNYATATIRQANANTANQLDMVIGLSEDSVNADIQAMHQNSTTSGAGYVMVGLDSTTTMATGALSTAVAEQAGGLGAMLNKSSWKGFPGLGRHTLVWLERGDGTATQTWYGDNGNPTFTQSGIHGEIQG